MSESGLRVYLLCYYLVWGCAVCEQLRYARVAGWVGVLVGGWGSGCQWDLAWKVLGVVVVGGVDTLPDSVVGLVG